MAQMGWNHVYDEATLRIEHSLTIAHSFITSGGYKYIEIGLRPFQQSAACFKHVPEKKSGSRDLSLI